MFKRITAFIAAALTAAALLTPGRAKAAQAEPVSLAPVRAYTTGQFEDVQRPDWYAMSVQISYEYGLLDGRGGGRFAPGAVMNRAEAVKVTSILSSLARTGRADFPAENPWHAPYIDYAVKQGILPAAPKDLAPGVTRAEFAELLCRALPEAVLSPVNDVADGAIPDVAPTDPWGPAVYALYRAGVVMGRDDLGRFDPKAPLSRAEAAAMLSRAVSPEARCRFTLTGLYTGEEIYRLCAPSVFYLERYNTEGGLIGFGSGFFISEDGVAVTNYHVIQTAASASVTTYDGKVYMISSVLGYDEDLNIAIVKVSGSGFRPLRIGSARDLAIGETVYTIGNPMGMTHSFSSGTVTGLNVSLKGESQTYIQFSAPISVGNGGGPLLNARGEVVGLTALMLNGAQNANFAVPADGIAQVERTEGTTLLRLLSQTASVSFYSYYFPAPDYGVFTGTPIYDTVFDPVLGTRTYYYNVLDIQVPDEVAVDGYVELLESLGFEEERTYETATGSATVFFNEMYQMELHFGLDTYDGLTCRFVSIY